MIKFNKRVATRIVTVFLMSLSITACASTEKPLSDTQSQEENVTETEKSKQTVTVARDPNAPAEPEKNDVASGQMAEMGEAVSEIDVQEEGIVPDAMVYTINKAEQFTDYVQAGISKDELNPVVEGDVLDEQGNLKSGVKLIVVEMTIENICVGAERNITSFSLLCADSAEDISDDTDVIDFFEAPIPVYFSNPNGQREGDNWKDYYFYNLPAGQSKNVKVGWYIDTDQFDLSKLYLVYNRYNDEYKKYVKIEFAD